MDDPDAHLDKFRQWAALKAQATEISQQQNRLRDDLMAVVIQGGEGDELGSFRWHFPVTVDIAGKVYKGIKREARTSTVLNEARALKLAEAEGIESEVVVHIPTLDLDALYRVYADGRLTREQIDALFDSRTTHAFKPVEQ